MCLVQRGMAYSWHALIESLTNENKRQRWRDKGRHGLGRGSGGGRAKRQEGGRDGGKRGEGRQAESCCWLDVPCGLRWTKWLLLVAWCGCACAFEGEKERTGGWEGETADLQVTWASHP